MNCASRWKTGCLAGLTLALAQCSSSSPGANEDAGAEDAAPVDATTDSGASGDAASDAVVCPPPTTTDGGTNAYAPDDPNIQYSGRFDFTNPQQPKFTASAVQISAKFQGTKVSVRLHDQGNNGVNFFTAIVDDFPPVLVTPQTGISTFDVTPPGLCDGVHTVTLAKRTEADDGTSNFLGFNFVGTILPPDPKPTRKIEIVGDSITCGAGVEAKSTTAPECSQNGLVDSSGTPQSGYGQGVENGYLAYGSVLGRALGAEYHVTCTSGIGLVRNYYNRDDRTMPVLYDLMYPGYPATMASPLWDTTQFVPDVVVIGLGTNDFSRDSGDTANPRPPMDIGTLAQGYVSFINQLATYYPGVTVVLVSSPILGDMYPTASDLQLTDHRATIYAVAAYYAGDAGALPPPATPAVVAGDAGEAGIDDASGGEGGAIDGAGSEAGAAFPPPAKVRVIPAIVDKVLGTGCGGHPSVAQQAAAAAQIAPVIKSAMGW